MIKRNIEKEILILKKEFPVLAILGPRQSGKTTLVKKMFPKYKYISFEDIDNREFAKIDPRGLLEKYSDKVIFDEIQRTPELFSYLQTHVDKYNTPGKIILTGSHNFLLMQNISQSLAGRVGIVKLLPFTIKELYKKYKFSFDNYIFKGFYPRIYDQNIRPSVFYKNYISTYIEKDVRLIKNISKYDLFTKFIKILAGRIGQLINTLSVSEDLGISHNTVQEWISVLETSYIVFKLKPYYKNYKKRLIKNYKLYFVDTGLVCNLVGIKKYTELDLHFLKGNIFENFIIMEYIKKNFNSGELSDLYFWRDKSGKEIDLLIDKGTQTTAIEIKSGKTIQSSFFDNLKYWCRISGNTAENCKIIYGGNEQFVREKMEIIPWNQIYNNI